MGDNEESAFAYGEEWEETLAQINLDLASGSQRTAPDASGNAHQYTYQNVPITFPYPAYKSQQQMMEKIIEGVSTGENCLLESPTGTGKTAALLCALLAWRRHCIKTNDNCSGVINEAARKLGGCTCGFIKDPNNTSVSIQAPSKEKPNEIFLVAKTARVSSSVHDFNNPPQKRMKREAMESSVEKRHIEDVCRYCIRKYVVDKSGPPKIYYLTRTLAQVAQVVNQLKVTAYKDTKMTVLAGREPTCVNRNMMRAANQGLDTPKLNDIEDLKLTLDDYCRSSKKNYVKYKRMLENQKEESSDQNSHHKKEYSHNRQAQKPIKAPEFCKYFRPKEELIKDFARLRNKGPWDLEDIKNEGIECHRCPYYGTQALHESADIVFGTYNYLLQPSIRKAANVKHINSVLVFDEAHNIEDICRDIFSIVLNVEQLDRHRIYIDEMHMKATSPHSRVQISTLHGLRETSVLMKTLSDQIKEWGRQEVEKLYKTKKQVNKPKIIQKYYETDQLYKALIKVNLTVESITRCIVQLVGEKNEKSNFATQSTQCTQENGGGREKEDEYYFDSKSETKQLFKISSNFINFLKKIRQCLKHFFAEEREGIGGGKDFKGYLVGTPKETGKFSANLHLLSKADFQKTKASRNSRAIAQKQVTKSGNNSFLPLNQSSLQNHKPSIPEYVFKLQIICLNPALGFKVLRNSAYSIILTSGTLTPLDSFASELDTKFAVRLQANHVIPPSNVWAGVISTGPWGKELHLNRDNQNRPEIQDELGRIVLQICKTVLNGVLVFFPSYTLMNSLKDRWSKYPTVNPIMAQINSCKSIFTEESQDKNAFVATMQQYKSCVTTGSVLFAVFRGKVSEGLDFADDQARAVVTIGIPYSNLTDPATKSKRKYNTDNNTKRSGGNLLSGNEWYKTQAFRALNQAFGRCVRHSEDWGALILIDSRLSQNTFRSYLSGWVKTNLKPYGRFQEAKSSLETFIDNMQSMKSKKPKNAQNECDDPDYQMNSQDDQMLTQVASKYDDGPSVPQQGRGMVSAHAQDLKNGYPSNDDDDSDHEFYWMVDSLECSINEDELFDVSMTSAQNSQVMSQD